MMDSETKLAELHDVRANARRLASPEEIDAAVARMATEITEKLSQTNPLVLGVMTGGVVPLVLLLNRLDFPLQVDYVHLGRYGLRTSGGELKWIKFPPKSVAGRTVLVVDDLLDHGISLAAVVDECQRLGAAQVLTAVLITKLIENRAGLASTDFSGLTIPNEYVFGYGMDYKTYMRNAPGIFSIEPEA